MKYICRECGHVDEIGAETGERYTLCDDCQAPATVMDARLEVAEKIAANRGHRMGPWGKDSDGSPEAQCMECGMNLFVSCRKDCAVPVQGWAVSLNCGMPWGPGAQVGYRSFGDTVIG